MPPERPIPDWAHADREMDMAWIRENLDTFWPLAREIFLDHGRGAFVVDTTWQPEPDAGHPFGYLVQEQLDEGSNEDLKRMVREYKPAREFVIHLLKEEPRESCYRVQVQRKGTNGQSRRLPHSPT